jgi:hypothetical protein
MFPNIRLMVVAILAAIAGISCGLGLFATFRVNHEPLARLADGSPPLQLGLDNLALGSEARLPVGGIAKVVAVPAIAAPSHPAPDQAAVDSANARDPSLQQAAVATGADDQSNTINVAVVVPPDQSGATPEAVAPRQQETGAAAQDQQPAAAAAMATPVERVAAVNAAAAGRQPAANPPKPGESKATKPTAGATRAAPARRAAKTVRARRIVATAAAQPAYQYGQSTYAQPTYSQPTYTWLDGTAQASHPVKRVQIKRHRVAKKVLPAAQSNPSAATADLNGIQ